MADIDLAALKAAAEIGVRDGDDWLLVQQSPAAILALVERVRRLEAIRLLARNVVKECDEMGAVNDGAYEMDELRAALAALDDKDKETTK